ncbi:type II toxin-antitoxin system HicA family toxin [Planktothrix mougeotii]|uniref:Type II toxin-antitoxin system HicA family toxin n=1 Tax=Planktothrix mougeotii LEGE 06226 TaxID=1828728 RepID=A0ABR9U7T0_9CYAN|nr:type II toxin-antitoxin system HicA family toxin [Planktothrix mougeotii]MBE9142521.1 type II toxin-antitoxin system HicA family toxin [Planktothrix mougeotii LEGE 06226]
MGFFTKFAPPTCKQVKTALKNMGFEPQKQDGTSHEQWKKIVNGKLYKVTVDCPKAPFSKTLVKSMASQAGVSKKVFLEYCFDKKLKDDPHQ